MRSSVPSQLQSSKSSYTVERGGRSLGIARHWQPVLRMYISPFTTSRTFTVRLLPPRLPGRMSGSTWLHSSSVKSLGYRSLLRSYRARFSIVHIGDLSTTQAAALASQTLDPIQEVPEQALIVPVPYEGREGALALAVLALVLLVVLQRWNRAFSLKSVRFVGPLRCWALQVPQRRRGRHTAYLIALLPYSPHTLLPHCRQA